MNEARSRLIVAVDVSHRTRALEVVDTLTGCVGLFKLGLEIFVREGPGLVEEVLRRGEKVFLDLKLHDIPNTVAGAVRSACALGVHMLTLHAAGGMKMLAAAREAADAAPQRPMLLAVTALTSLAPEDARSIGISAAIPEWAGRLAGLALRAGMEGIVASATDLPALRGQLGSRMRFIVPGIRPAGAAVLDQARIATPGEAILAGADFLVVGRPILNDPDPPAAAGEFVREIAAALSGRGSH